MAVKHFITGGLGLSPGTTKWLITDGFLAVSPFYAINGGTHLAGVFSDWQRVFLRQNPDGTIDYSPYAINSWQMSQMLMDDFEALRAQQGATLASLSTNDINNRNYAATYTTAILESVVNGGHEGIKALNVNIRFRVKVS